MTPTGNDASPEVLINSSPNRDLERFRNKTPVEIMTEIDKFSREVADEFAATVGNLHNKEILQSYLGTVRLGAQLTLLRIFFPKEEDNK